MSMICVLFRVTSKQLEEFLNDSSKLENLAFSDDIEASGIKLDLDKSWDAINFLLTGHSIHTIEEAEPPLSQIIFSGQIIDEDQDMGYGPAQYLQPDQVKTISIELSKISSEEFINRYNSEKLNEMEVYPHSWEDSESEKEYLILHFEELKKFYSNASNEGQAIITFIS